jgi:hypothetical protein
VTQATGKEQVQQCQHQLNTSSKSANIVDQTSIPPPVSAGILPIPPLPIGVASSTAYPARQPIGTWELVGMCGTVEVPMRAGG